jgi:hypothetical protein
VNNSILSITFYFNYDICSNHLTDATDDDLLRSKRVWQVVCSPCILI